MCVCLVFEGLLVDIEYLDLYKLYLFIDNRFDIKIVLYEGSIVFMY